jgi:outer membrane lipoprotein-sorting protein
MTARVAVLSLLLVLGCAPKAPTLPSGAGVPFPGFASAYAQATDGCAGVRTLTAVMSLSGRAGKLKLRGRIDAGLEAPDRIVLEVVAPFGKPFFVLAASGSQSTLVLPRDGRFLTGAPPEAIVDAITGVALDPSELRMVLAGCGMPGGDAASGQSFDGGWASVDTGGTTTWLRQIDGRWRVAAATRESIAVHYSDFGASRPSTVRLRVSVADGADLTLRLSDVDVNVPLDPAVYSLDIPRDATPITLEELRRSGPLGRQ